MRNPAELQRANCRRGQPTLVQRLYLQKFLARFWPVPAYQRSILFWITHKVSGVALPYSVSVAVEISQFIACRYRTKGTLLECVPLVS